MVSSSKLPTEEKPHLPSGWQQKRLSSIHPLQFNHWSISKTHFFSYKTSATIIAETSRRRNHHRRNVLDPIQGASRPFNPALTMPNIFFQRGRFFQGKKPAPPLTGLVVMHQVRQLKQIELDSFEIWLSTSIKHLYGLRATIGVLFSRRVIVPWAANKPTFLWTSPVGTGDFGGLSPPKQSSEPPKLKRETL